MSKRQNFSPSEPATPHDSLVWTVFLVGCDIQTTTTLSALLRERIRALHAEHTEPNQALPQAPDPRLAIVDLDAPRLGGVAGMHRLHRAEPALHILALSHVQHPALEPWVLAHGGHGLVAKTPAPAEYALAIEAMIGGQAFFSPAVLTSTSEQDRLAPLNAEQWTVFRLWAQDHDDAAIAALMDVEQQRINAHKRGIRRKLGARRLRELLRLERLFGMAGGQETQGYSYSNDQIHESK